MNKFVVWASVPKCSSVSPSSPLTTILIFLSLALLMAFNVSAADQEFPGRDLYPGVDWVSLERLYETKDVSVIVDARSAYEYQTLHILNALNVPLNSKDFVTAIQILRADYPNAPIVFYCNGHSCMKSYKATQKAKNAGIPNVFVYDAGIFEWAKAHPEYTKMLGRSPIDPKALLSKAKLNKHMLDNDAFGKMVHSDDTLLIDIRDQHQTDAIKFWPMKQDNIPLDNEKLRQYVSKAKRENKTLLVYDAVGKQVRWLQYFFEAEGLHSYYFLKGGAKAYYATMLSEMNIEQ